VDAGALLKPAPRRILCWAAALLVAGTVVPVSARVFVRRGYADRGYVAPEQLGWTAAYTTVVQLNGGSGQVEILESRADLDRTLGLMRDAYRRMGARCFIYPGDLAAWGLVFVQGRVIRFLAFAPLSGRQTLLLRLDQSEDDFLTSLHPPTDHALEDLPGYPGLRPVQCTVDEGTRTALQVAEVDAPPDEVHFRYAESMAAAGWTPALPLPSQQRDPSRFTLYLKGTELCLVSVRAGGGPRQAVLTLIRKRSADGAGL